MGRTRLGSWSNGVNWSLTSGGVEGAGTPAVLDAVILNNNTGLFLGISPTIYSLETAPGPVNAVIYTSLPSTLTINNHLTVTGFSSLKDSTDGDVPFNVVFNAATHAIGTVIGDWIFEGGTPLTGGTEGVYMAAVKINGIPLQAVKLVKSR